MIGESSPRLDCPNCGMLSVMSPRDRMLDGRYRCRQCGTVFDPFSIRKDGIALVQSGEALIGTTECIPPQERSLEFSCPFCKSAVSLSKSNQMLDGRFMCPSCGCPFEESAAIPRGFAHDDLPKPTWAIPTETDEDELASEKCMVFGFVAAVLFALLVLFAH